MNRIGKFFHFALHNNFRKTWNDSFILNDSTIGIRIDLNRFCSLKMHAKHCDATLCKIIYNESSSWNFYIYGIKNGNDGISHWESACLLHFCKKIEINEVLHSLDERMWLWLIILRRDLCDCSIWCCFLQFFS